MTSYEMNRKPILAAINTYIAVHGYSPTVEDVTDLMGWSSKSSAHYILKRLIDEKLITVAPGSQPRTMRLTAAAMKTLEETA